MTRLRYEITNVIWFIKTWPTLAFILAVGAGATGFAIGYLAARLGFNLGWFEAAAVFAMVA